ncbi:MAG: hypothetical protein MHM6MM_008618 [Cercozoa sp. M6MM]
MIARIWIEWGLVHESGRYLFEAAPLNLIADFENESGSSDSISQVFLYDATKRSTMKAVPHPFVQHLNLFIKSKTGHSMAIAETLMFRPIVASLELEFTDHPLETAEDTADLVTHGLTWHAQSSAAASPGDTIQLLFRYPTGVSDLHGEKCRLNVQITSTRNAVNIKQEKKTAVTLITADVSAEAVASNVKLAIHAAVVPTLTEAQTMTGKCEQTGMWWNYIVEVPVQ